MFDSCYHLNIYKNGQNKMLNQEGTAYLIILPVTCDYLQTATLH